jgi:osmotically-inducible protein OsmY
MKLHNRIRQGLVLLAALLLLAAVAAGAQSTASEPSTEDFSGSRRTAQMDGIEDRPSVPDAETDWEIERNVKKALFRNPYVDSEDIDVTVNEGVVRLTGTVMTWSEREQAEKSARQGGARSVDNDLAVVRGPGSEQP